MQYTRVADADGTGRERACRGRSNRGAHTRSDYAVCTKLAHEVAQRCLDRIFREVDTQACQCLPSDGVPIRSGRQPSSTDFYRVTVDATCGYV